MTDECPDCEAIVEPVVGPGDDQDYPHCPMCGARINPCQT